MITLWSQLAAIKVRHNNPIQNSGLTAIVKGARGEGVAVQVVLTRTHLKNTCKVEIRFSWPAKFNEFMCADTLRDLSRTDH